MHSFFFHPSNSSIESGSATSNSPFTQGTVLAPAAVLIYGIVGDFYFLRIDVRIISIAIALLANAAFKMALSND